MKPDYRSLLTDREYRLLLTSVRDASPRAALFDSEVDVMAFMLLRQRPPGCLTGKVIEWVTEASATRPRTRHIAEVMEDHGAGMLELYPGKVFLARGETEITVVGPNA